LQVGDVRRFLVVPVLAGGHWWGTVSFLNSTTERAWDEHEITLLQTTGEMIAIFLQRITAEQALRERISELLALSQIAQALTRWANLPRALDRIRGRLTELFDAAEITCGILNAYGDGLAQLLRITAVQTTTLGSGLKLTDDRIVREVIDSGQATIMSNKPLVDLRTSTAAPVPDARAACQMLLPVQARGSVIGLLRIVAADPDRSYGAADLALAQTIAGTLANAFENGRLFVNERRQRQFAESLREVATAVTSSLDFETVIHTIFEQLSQVVQYDGAGLFMPADGELVFLHGVGRSAPCIGQTLSLTDKNPATQIFRERQPQIVDDTTKHPGWISWGPEDIALSWMGVPLVIGGAAIGVLAADHIAPGMYSLDDLRNLQAFADIAAIAIDNAKRYQHAHLAAIEEERKRLAHDLHDSVSQTLFSANLIAGILPELWELDQQRGQSALADLQRLARGAQAEMRTLLLEMHAPALVKGSLDELLNPLVMSSSAKIASEVDLRLDRAPPLPPDVQIALYRIAQEALNNVVRHSHAQRITVHLEVEPAVAHDYGQPWAGEIRLNVSDNGRGFEPTAAAAQGRLGLVSLRERAAAVGATLLLSSQPGAGTQVCVIWSGKMGAH
jgi:signal transduction histidine kinase